MDKPTAILPGLIRRVAIVGGTHGNELTGVYLVKRFQQFPHLLSRQSFECIALLANPGAIAANRRYLDRDLNRCFSNTDLADLTLTSYEDQQAKEILRQLGSKEQPKVDLIIDMHSSTSKMGLSIIPSTLHPFNLRLAGYLSQLHADVRVCCGMYDDQDSPMLRSITPLGCAIEVGAIAQGILDAERFQQTEMLVHAILDYIDAINQGNPLLVPPAFTLYRSISSLDFPRDEDGELQGMVHPQLQFRDYNCLAPGDPLFLTFTGETLYYQGSSPTFPIFINEAAYYEKGIAMFLTDQQQVSLKD